MVKLKIICKMILKKISINSMTFSWKDSPWYWLINNKECVNNIVMIEYKQVKHLIFQLVLILYYNDVFRSWWVLTSKDMHWKCVWILNTFESFDGRVAVHVRFIFALCIAIRKCLKDVSNLILLHNSVKKFRETEFSKYRSTWYIVDQIIMSLSASS